MFSWWERQTWRFASVGRKGLGEALSTLLEVQTGSLAPDRAMDVAMDMSDQGPYSNVFCWQQRYVMKLFTG